MKDNTKAIIAVILATVVGGALPVYVKIGLKTIPPFTFTFLRFLVASIFLTPLILKEKPKFDKNIVLVILISLLATVNIFLFSFGVRLTTASIGQMIYAATPIVTAILAYFILKDKVTFQKIIGIICGFIGSAMIIFLPILGRPSLMKGNLSGNLLIVIGMVISTLYYIFSKKIQKKHSPLYITSVFIFTSVVISFVFSIHEQFQRWWINIPHESIIAILYVGVIGTVVYYLLYQYAVKYGSPLVGSMILYLQPIATVIWAFYLLGERMTDIFFTGSLLSLVGAWLVLTKKQTPLVSGHFKT